MLKKIEAIRKKPKEVRVQYAFWIALIFTLIITGFWLVSTSSKLVVLAERSNQKVNEKNQGSISKNFSAVRAALSEKFTSFGQQKNDKINTQTSTPNEGKGVIDLETLLTSTSSKKKQDDSSSAKQILIGTSSVSSSSIGY